MNNTLDLHYILWNDLPKHMSEDDYELVIQILKESYKSSFIQLNQNQAQYNNLIKDLNDKMQGLQEQLAIQTKISGNFRSKLTEKLTLKERLFGKIDLNRLTQITDKASQP
jgi:hypothetical protein